MEITRQVHGTKTSTQITVPVEVRRQLDIEPGDQLEIQVAGHNAEVPVGKKGLITIPKSISDELEIDPHDQITLTIEA